MNRRTGEVICEQLLADRIVNFLYSGQREDPGLLQRALASGRVTDWLAHWEFDRTLANPDRALRKAVARLGIDVTEMLDPLESLSSYRELFERRIRYWQVRPLPLEQGCVVSPADGKVLPFTTTRDTALPVKTRFLSVAAILGETNPWSRWPDLPLAGVVVRLTPDVYHYTHAPVAGVVRRHVLVEGAFHSCNPTALTMFPRSYAVNRRAITVYDTDVEGGTQVGLVVQVDVAAMMIGRIESRFSAVEYRDPKPVVTGQFVPRGAPVSLFRPGSSTSIVFWDARRASLERELVANARRGDLRSRFSDWLGSPWVETFVRVREAVSEPRCSQETTSCP